MDDYDTFIAQSRANWDAMTPEQRAAELAWALSDIPAKPTEAK